MRATALAILALCWLPRDVAADPRLDALVAAYADHLTRYDNGSLVWSDGTRMPVSDGRTVKIFLDLLNAPDILDQFAIPYPVGGEFRTPAQNEDPGRIRNERFFS